MRRIRRKFLQLTSHTYPHGYEKMLEKYLPKGYKIDQFGNYFIQIGNNPTSMFTCHLDTACVNHSKVNHTFRLNGEVIATDGTTILGADDKAGMIVSLHMIDRKIPGLYYFFLGEEVGCIGSKKLAALMSQQEVQSINKVVSFDRRGFESVITHQYAGRCASDEFAQNLSNELNKGGLRLKPDNTGICTDSVQFQEFISECTNISVGYFNEHTGDECQNIKFLKILCNAVVNVDWQNLPTYRNPDELNFNDDTDDEEEGYFNYEGRRNFNRNYFTYIKDPQDRLSVIKVFISLERVNHEIEKIYHLMNEYGTPILMEEIDWNGNIMTYDFNNGKGPQKLTRAILCKLDKEFGFIDNKDLRYNQTEVA